MQRFGAFYMDYLYTMENSSGKGIVLVIPPHRACLLTLITVTFSPSASVFSSNRSSFSLSCLSADSCLSESQPPTWSLTFPVLALTPNVPGGQLSEVCSHIFDFLSLCCLSKHCFPSCLCLSTCLKVNRSVSPNELSAVSTLRHGQGPSFFSSSAQACLFTREIGPLTDKTFLHSFSIEVLSLAHSGFCLSFLAAGKLQTVALRRRFVLIL